MHSYHRSFSLYASVEVDLKPYHEAIKCFKGLPHIIFIIQDPKEFEAGLPSYLEIEHCCAYAIPMESSVTINSKCKDNLCLILHELTHIVTRQPIHDDVFYEALEATGRVKIGELTGYKDYKEEELI